MPLRNYGPIFRQASSVPAFEPVEQLLRHRRGERVPSLARHREQLAQQLGSLAAAGATGAGLRDACTGAGEITLGSNARVAAWPPRSDPTVKDGAVKLARYADHAGLRLRVE